MNQIAPAEWSSTLKTLDQTRRKSISLQEQVDGAREPWYAQAPTYDLYGYGESLCAESVDCQNTYAQGICRLFCQQFYSKLPRELRDMVYNFMHTSLENRRKWISPATNENLRYYGPDIVRELAESYYRTKHLFLSSETPEGRMKLFTTDVTGLVPALLARKVYFRVDPYIFYNPSREDSQQVLRTLGRIRPMRSGTKVRFQISPVWYDYIRNLNSGIKHFFPMLEELQRAGLKIEIQFSMQGPWSRTQPVTCKLNNDFRYEQFEAKTLKYVAIFKALSKATDPDTDHDVDPNSDPNAE